MYIFDLISGESMNFIGLVAVVLVGIWSWQKHPVLVSFCGLFCVGAIAYSVMTGRKKAREYREMFDRMTPQERTVHEQVRQERMSTVLYGPVNHHLICMHCTTVGQVRSKSTVRSTTAVTNTIAKVRATTNREVTQRHCDNCQTTWDL
jgi:hypothetical protein